MVANWSKMGGNSVELVEESTKNWQKRWKLAANWLANQPKLEMIKKIKWNRTNWVKDWSVANFEVDLRSRTCLQRCHEKEVGANDVDHRLDERGVGGGVGGRVGGRMGRGGVGGGVGGRMGGGGVGGGGGGANPISIETSSILENLNIWLELKLVWHPISDPFWFWVFGRNWVRNWSRFHPVFSQIVANFPVEFFNQFLANFNQSLANFQSSKTNFSIILGSIFCLIFHQFFTKIRPISKWVPTNFILTISTYFSPNSTKFSTKFDQFQNAFQPILFWPFSTYFSPNSTKFSTKFDQSTKKKRNQFWLFLTNPPANCWNPLQPILTNFHSTLDQLDDHFIATHNSIN